MTYFERLLKEKNVDFQISKDFFSVTIKGKNSIFEEFSKDIF